MRRWVRWGLLLSLSLGVGLAVRLALRNLSGWKARGEGNKWGSEWWIWDGRAIWSFGCRRMEWDFEAPGRREEGGEVMRKEFLTDRTEIGVEWRRTLSR